MKKVLLVMLLSSVKRGERSAGGVDSVCQVLTAALADRIKTDFTYEIIAFNPLNDSPIEGEVTELADHIKVFHYNCNATILKNKIRIPGILWQNIVIRKHARILKPDIYHSHLPSWQVISYNNSSSINTLHSYKKIGRSSWSMANNFIHEIISPILAARNTDHYTTVSQFLKNAVFQDVNLPITVIHNPLNDEFLESSTKEITTHENSINIVTCSAVTERKGIHHAINALKEIVSHDIDCTLSIIGPTHDKVYLSKINNLINEHDLKNRVVFHGPLSIREIKEIYAKSDYGLFLSAEETFGLVPLEMMACGLETICTRVGILHDEFERFQSLGVKICESINPKEISEYVISKKRSNFQSIIKMLERDFSSQGVAQKYEDLYRSVLSKC